MLHQTVDASTIDRKPVTISNNVKAIEVYVAQLYCGEVYEDWDGRWTTTNLEIAPRHHATQESAETALVAALKKTLKWVDENPVASPELKEFYRQKLIA